MVADPNDRCQFQLGIIKEHDNHYICTKHVSLKLDSNDFGIEISSASQRAAKK